MTLKKFFHGTNLELTELQADTYVTKSFKDACRFGYRKAVKNNSMYVYIYTLECSDTRQDKNRDRAFILNECCSASLINKYDTYNTPFKLKKFKMKII